MKKVFICLLMMFISLNLLASITHIWPSSGVNDTTITVHIFGDGFNSGVTNVNLYKSGNPLITGTNISVVNDNYLTCDFDLTGVLTTTYNAIVNTDTLDMCFTVNDHQYNLNVWNRTVVISAFAWMIDVSVGDGNNNGLLEVYGTCGDRNIIQFIWNGSNWDSTSIGMGNDIMNEITIGDGNNNGHLEVYGANFDDHIYHFSWNGSSWNKTDLGFGGSFMIGVAVGDGNNDGKIEVYGSCGDNHIYQFSWNGSSWDKTDIGSGGDNMIGVAVGDGNNDGEIEVYGSCGDNHIYQFSWNGSNWDKTDLGLGGGDMVGAVVGDGNNDGVLEVYGSCEDNHIYQFSWNGSNWDQADLGSGGDNMTGVVVGDGNNDGEIEVYGACEDYYIYQFKWNGSSWNKTSIGYGNYEMLGVDIGDGNNDGQLEVYGSNYSNCIYQYKVIPEPKLELLDTFHDFSFINLNDTAHWQYLRFENVGDSFLVVDSIIISNNDFSIYNYVLPDTVNIGDSSLVEIIFSPSVEGIITGTLSIYSNDSLDPLQFVYLQGEGDSTNPNIPDLIVPLNGEYYSYDSITLRWTAVSFKSAPVRYVIEIDTVINFNSPISIDTIIDNRIDKILTENFYYWHVKAFDLAGNESPFSDPDSFGVDMIPPMIESTTVWTDTSYQGPFTVNVKITDNSLDTCFLYYKRIEDPDFQITELSSTGGNWFTAEIPQVNLNPDTVKYYILAKDIAIPANEATDPVGAPGNYYSFVVNSVDISEILEIPAIFTFSYSYPSSGEIIFNLAIPEVSDISLKIFDISGREVSSLVSGQLSPAFYNIPFRPLSKGTYFYRLESSYQNKSGKFIIVE